jgi:outer membrane protein OmpA-like peptidoglycan-associated protein
MRSLKNIIIECVGVLVLASGLAAAPAPVRAQDHPLLSGMPGFKIGARKLTVFGVYSEGNLFFCQPNQKCTSAVPGFDDAGKLVAEGKITALNYGSNQPAGTLAVYRNYETAIRSVGGRKLSYEPGHEGTHVFLVDKDGRKVWVVLVNDYDSGYKLTFIESKPLVQVVTAGQLADAIRKQGFATLHVNFDNNKATLRPDAKPALGEVVALLKADPGLKLSVDGHTDNVGQAAANRQLSQDRAASVVKAIAAEGVEAGRLKARGWGADKPVADNRTDAGRAQNRRVELVKLP